MSEEKKSVNHNSPAGCLVSIGIIIVFFLILYLMIMSGSKDGGNSSSVSSSGIVTSGSRAYISEDTILSTSKEALERMHKNTGDGVTVNQMILTGDLVLLKAGTEVYVVDRGLATSEVEVISSGVRGLVPSDRLQK